MKLGLLKLTDAAPVIMAHEWRLFATEDVDVSLSIEPSWANIADKLAHGFLDAAVIVPPLGFAVALGLRGPACPVIVPQAISLGGNTVTLSAEMTHALAAELQTGAMGARAKARAFAQVLKGATKRTLAVVHRYSTHNLLLRYWLAAGGIDPERDVTLTVVPPAQMVEALESGHIDGFCAGAPWGALAEARELGATVVTSHDIWRNGPEKALAVSEDWANRNPAALQSVLRALLRAGRLCDEPGNADAIARVLSASRYIGVAPETIAQSLPKHGPGDQTGSLFFRHAANFPWRSHALWFLEQMRRWDLIPADTDIDAAAKRVYRPDLHAIAAQRLGMPVPKSATKTEGHPRPWQCDAEPEPIAMEPDGFCDGPA